MKHQQIIFLKRTEDATELMRDAGYSVNEIAANLEEKFSDPDKQPAAQDFFGALSMLRVIGNSLMDNSENLQKILFTINNMPKAQKKTL